MYELRKCHILRYFFESLPLKSYEARLGTVLEAVVINKQKDYLVEKPEEKRARFVKVYCNSGSSGREDREGIHELRRNNM